VFILQLLKVLCFDTDLQVFILKVVSRAADCELGIGSCRRGCDVAWQARRRCIARFTAHDSRGSTRGQLIEGWVEGQVVKILKGNRKTQIRTLQSRTMRHRAGGGCWARALELEVFEEPDIAINGLLGIRQAAAVWRWAWASEPAILSLKQNVGFPLPINACDEKSRRIYACE
jgi:hypothetical protein